MDGDLLPSACFTYTKSFVAFERHRTPVQNEQKHYGWENAQRTCAHEYLLPAILQSLPLGKGLRILDLGCGNGFVAGHLANLGHHVVGVDASGDGIEIARAKYLNAKFHVASLYDDALKAAVGYEYQVVISSEVIEHLYWPKVLLRRAHDALAVGGRLIVTTPYHGYLKNLALSLVGGWDKHFDVAWDGGHIKFFSNATLSSLMAEAGFVRLGFRGAGRFPGLWKSMIMQGEKG